MDLNPAVTQSNPTLKQNGGILGGVESFLSDLFTKGKVYSGGLNKNVINPLQRVSDTLLRSLKGGSDTGKQYASVVGLFDKDKGQRLFDTSQATASQIAKAKAVNAKLNPMDRDYSVKEYAKSEIDRVGKSQADTLRKRKTQKKNKSKPKARAKTSNSSSQKSGFTRRR